MTATADIIEALQGGWTQNNRFLRINTTLGSDVLMAEKVEGWESIDHGGFRLHVSALTTNIALPVETTIGAPVLLEWRQSDADDNWRPLHGHIVVVERTGHNGGLARVQFVIEPWLSVLHQHVDSYHYHNASAIDISEQIFRYYSRGVVAPAWRWALADRTIYAKRSLTVQAGESDFDFLARSWAEEGLFYWFEHKPDTGSTSFGAHTLVLCDANQGFTPSTPEAIPLHQTGESDPAAVITPLMPKRRWRIGQVARASWDYRSLSARPTEARVQGAVVPGEDRDVAAPYAYQTTALGDRWSRRSGDRARAGLLCIARHRHAVGVGSDSWAARRSGIDMVFHTKCARELVRAMRVRSRARKGFFVDHDVQRYADKDIKLQVTEYSTSLAAVQ